MRRTLIATLLVAVALITSVLTVHATGIGPGSRPVNETFVNVVDAPATQSDVPPVIEVWTWVCPDDVVEATVGAYMFSCALGASVGLPLTLSADGSLIAVGSSFPGYTGWRPSVAGPTSITISDPNSRLHEPVVFCDYRLWADTVTPSVYAPQVVAGGQISATVDQNYALECHWFQFPGGIPGGIDFELEEPSPSGIGPRILDRADLVPLPLLVGSVRPAATASPRVFDRADLTPLPPIVGPARPTTTDVVANPSVVRVSVPSAASSGRPFGGSDRVDANRPAARVSSPSASASLSASVNPSDRASSSIVIEVFSCPADQDLEIAAREGECLVPVDGITFIADGPGDDPIQTDTGDSRPGAVVFGGIDPGRYTMTTPDDPAAPAVASCDGVEVTVTAGVAVIDLPARVDLACQWFIPGTGDAVAEPTSGPDPSPSPDEREMPEALVDTDADGIIDQDETGVYGTDPLVADTDADGLLDGAELTWFGTDPLDADSDDDTFSDGSEVEIGSDPLDDQQIPVS